ncbi:MAG: hypothetical protein IH985_08355 [Planctomycetes bacterium]|nr:hypothetical protein [Planctomycetota bacterium]
MTRPAFTLFEALAATVVLTVAATACARLIGAARRSLEAPRRDVHSLARLADSFMADPTSFGIDPSAVSSDSFVGIEINWPDAQCRSPVKIERLEAQDPDEGLADYVYLVFEDGDGVVIRSIALPETAP